MDSQKVMELAQQMQDLASELMSACEGAEESSEEAEVESPESSGKGRPMPKQDKMSAALSAVRARM
jgi:hypothetical protein